MSQAWKQQRLQDFLTQTRIKVGLILNPNHETRKNKNKNTTFVNKNQRFIVKKKQNKAMIRNHTQN